MRILTTTKAKVLAKTARKSQDGTKEYYNLAIIQGGECGNISCNESIFKEVKEDTTYMFESVFNTEYKSFALSRILNDCPAPASSPSGRVPASSGK